MVVVAFVVAGVLVLFHTYHLFMFLVIRSFSVFYADGYTGAHGEKNNGHPASFPETDLNRVHAGSRIRKSFFFFLQYKYSFRNPTAVLACFHFDLLGRYIGVVFSFIFSPP